MIYKIYNILHHLLFAAGFQKGLKIVVPINIGASLALFTAALIILIFKLLNFSIEFVTSQRFFYIVFLLFSITSVVFFLIKGKNNITLGSGEVVMDRNNIILLVAYSLVTVVAPIVVFIQFLVGLNW